MRNIVLALREVTNWHSVGVALEIKPYKLEEIRLNRMNDVQQCKFSLIDHWLRTDLEASWRKLASALDEAGEHTSANKIRAKYPAGGGKGGNGGISMCTSISVSMCILVHRNGVSIVRDILVTKQLGHGYFLLLKMTHLYMCVVYLYGLTACYHHVGVL